MPVRGLFRPRYIQAEELGLYGLPDGSAQSNILALVDGASNLIDEYCGRQDGTGQGSLVYTTYAERLLLQARNRNIVRTSFKPLAVVPASTVQLLMASANAPIPAGPDQQAGLNTNWTWTGVQPNTVVQTAGSTLSPIIGASGRYGYPRRSDFAIYPDLNYGMNPLQIASFFGGPPTFTPIDPTAIDYDMQTGEIWVPAGLYLSQYTEIMIVYNSGYDPTAMPNAIKHACAGIVRNMLAMAGGVTNLKGLNSGMVNAQFGDNLIDSTIQRWLAAFVNVIAY